MQLKKILEEIDQKIAKVGSIPISEDEFAADGEEIYNNGKTQGRYEELIWCRNIILKHINDGWIPVEECRESREKQISKECVVDSCPDHTHYKCPSCGQIQMSTYANGFPRLGRIKKHCENCGQALVNENLEGRE